MKAVRNAGLLFIILLITCFVPHRSECQDNLNATVYERLLRVEIPVKSDNETYRVVPLADKGLIVFYKSLELVDKEKVKWYFSCYDVDLKPQWSKGIALNTNLDYSNFSLDTDTLNLLFLANGKEKVSEQNIQVIRILLKKINFIGIPGKLPENAQIVDFKVCEHKAYIGFNTKNEPARMMIIDLLTGNMKTFLINQPEASFLTAFNVDSIEGKIISAVRKPLTKNQSCFLVSVIDSTGKIMGETMVSSLDREHDLKSIKFLSISSGEIIISGTYGSSSGQKSSAKDRIPEESTGVYFTSVKDFKQQSILFYNFLELKSADLLMGENEMESLKKKAIRKKRNLNEFSLDLTVLLHPLSLHNEEIILMIESFFPQYHTENFTDFDFYGRPFTNTYTIFDGYRFKNAIITCFDKTGKLLWDNTMEIRNLLSDDLRPKVNIFPSGNNFVMAYLSEGKVVSKIIHNSDVVEKIDFSDVESGFPNDKILKETKSRMIFWYDDFFICYGYQEIKNVSLDNNNKRWVFYFNKVKFD